MGATIRELAEGATLTQSAYAAGFSSSAHLSSAFRDMFGLSASEWLATDPVFYLDPATIFQTQDGLGRLNEPD